MGAISAFYQRIYPMADGESTDFRRIDCVVLACRACFFFLFTEDGMVPPTREGDS